MVSSDLTGKLVLVTEGSKDVGKAIAGRFAERGAQVIVNFFHSLNGSRQTVAEFRALGARVDVIRASVAQKYQVDGMFDEIEAKYGRLDILVNNAAWGALLGVGDIAEEHFERAIDINLKGALWCSRRAAALMARTGGGVIVNVSSAKAVSVTANHLVVGTFKAALESLTHYLAVEYAPRQIRVNTASGTLIDGDVAAMLPNPENIKQSSNAAMLLAPLATADDMADLVLFLASDAARWITGQVIVADCGLSLCREGSSPQRDSATPCAPVARVPPLAAKATAPALEPMAPSEAIELPGIEIAVAAMGLALPRANAPQRFSRTLRDRVARVPFVIQVLRALLLGNIPPQDRLAEALKDFSSLMRQPRSSAATSRQHVDLGLSHEGQGDRCR
jgi:NAD(P)-dependent dehydrogenase (short-subunit alcohol dehydrogenase family)